MPEVTDQAEEMPKHDPRQPLFTERQQDAFDKAWGRRERKIHAEYQNVFRDLFDTVDIATRLLQRCKDRLSVEDQVGILDGFAGIRKDWERKWQKEQRQQK